MNPAKSEEPIPPPSAPERADTKLLLVDPGDERAVEEHPTVAPWLQKGWQIRRTAPRLVESDGTTQLLVVLEPVEDETSSSSLAESID